MKRERISNVPSEVLDQILSRLRIREAARTSVLSSKWRYKFAMLPHLEFDDQCVLTQKDTTFSKIVDHVLLGHIGPIDTFRLYHRDVLATWDVDRRILVLSRNSIKDLILRIWTRYPYKMPSCFFSFHDVIHLDLYNCLILKPPSTFKGFWRLKSLSLQEVTFAGQDVLESLIACCPLIERLIMTECGGFTHLKFNAPNLKFLEVDADVLKKVNLENTMISADAAIDSDATVDQTWVPGSCSNLVKFFVPLPHIQKLEITRDLLKAFQEDQAVVGEGNSLSDENWNCQFTQLRLVQITGISGVKAELDLIRFLLSSSPVLDRMIVQPASFHGSHELVKKLAQFTGASAHAVIAFLDP